MGKEQRAKEAAMELSAGTLDARGRTLQEGDEILLRNGQNVYFRVMQITPTLDPQAPADLLLVHVGVLIPFAAKRGAVNPEFIRVRTAQEAGPMNIQLLEARPQGPTDTGGSER